MTQLATNNSDPAAGRRKSDRRSGDDRRRNTEQRAVAIEISDSQLHVVVVVQRTTGEQVANTTSVQWRFNAESLQDAAGEAELLAALKSLVTEQRLAGSRLLIALGGDLCVTRAVAGNNDEVVRELQELRERSRMYLTLGPGRKAVASSVATLDARHQHALLTVASQHTLDTLARVADEAGLQLAAIESSQAALCRLLGTDEQLSEQPLLVVQLCREQAHLSVVHKGRLLLDYRPGGRQVVSHLGELIDQHHHRLVRYCQRHYGMAASGLTRAVVVGGEVELGLAMAKQTRASAVKVEPLSLAGVSLPWQLGSAAPQPLVAAALGLALRIEDTSDTKFPDLMDSVVDVSRPPILSAMIKLLAPLAACLLVTAGLGVMNWRLETELAGMRERLDATQPIVIRAERLRNELISGRQEFTQLEQLATTMPTASWTNLVKNVSGCMPEDLWLESLQIADMQQLAVKGSSYTESGVYDFVGHLQHMPVTDEVALLGTSSGQGRAGVVTSFDVDLKLKASADPSLASSEAKTP